MTINHVTNLNLSNTPNFLSNQTAGDPNGDFSDHPSTPIHGGQRLTPRFRQVNSSGSAFGSFSTRFVNNYRINSSRQLRVKMMMMMRKKLGRVWYLRLKSVGVVLLMGLFFLVNWWILTRIPDSGRVTQTLKLKFLKANNSTTLPIQELMKFGKKRPQKTIYARLLAKAAHALAERHNKIEPRDLWVEPYTVASAWKPCSEERDWEPSDGSTGYIMISANGGINQQRVAVCNAVAVARLLNATLVIPTFLYSSVWRDVRRSIS